MSTGYKNPYLQNVVKINKFILDIVKSGGYSQLKKTFLYGINHLINPDRPKNPLAAVIGITNRCNLRCDICPRQTPLQEIENTDMSFENFKYIVDQLPFVNTISIVGLGEPFLHDDLFEMIRYVKAKNIAVSITSNGTLLTKQKAQELLSLGTGTISISLDTPDPENYEKLRKGAQFAKTAECIGNLVNIRNRSRSKIHIKINMTASARNYQEIPAFVDLADQLDVRIVEVNAIRCNMGSYQFLPADMQLHCLEDKDQIKKVFTLAQGKAKKHKISLILPPIEQPTRWSSCLRPWFSAFITIKGDVRQCCASMQVFGNVFEEDIKDIWKNEGFLNVRHRLRTNDIPESCVNCIFL